jgi:hypothetical protein
VALTLLAAAGCGGRSDATRIVGGANVDVSRTPGADGEVSVAFDPARPRVLLAGSNGAAGAVMRAYSSTDGGLRWTASVAARARPPVGCVSDPSVGIDPDGREYYAYIEVPKCAGSVAQEAGRVVVRTRSSAASPWSLPRVVAPGGDHTFQDRPALVVDTGPRSPHRGRVWIAWAQFSRDPYASTLYLSHSDDGGRRWSQPAFVGIDLAEESLAVAGDGSLVVAAEDFGDASLAVLRIAADGSIGVPTAFDAGVPSQRFWTCGLRLPAMPHRCVRAVPSVAVDDRSGRVYVAWSGLAADGTRDVFVRALDRRLRYRGAPVGTPPPLVRDSGGPSDQFLADAAVDQTNGDLWVCFYDTRGDSSRQRARWTCAVSSDGTRTWRFVAAADAASDETAAGADPFGYGDYEGVVAAGGVAHAVWTDGRRDPTLGEEIYAATLTARR